MLDVVATGVAIEVVIGLPVIRMGSADYTLIWRTAQALGPALIVLGVAYSLRGVRMVVRA